MERFSTLARTLVPVSLGYLALPYVVFFLGWLRWPIGLICASLVLLALGCVIRQAVRERDGIDGSGLKGTAGPPFAWRHAVLVFLVSVALLVISGVGGFGHQDTDWLKHNGILKDLVERPWPVVYRLGGRDVPLVYYVAYYLPAALIGKLAGWSLANWVLFAWTLVGLVLAMAWFLVLVRRVSFAVLLLFVVFSGLDVVGRLLVTPAVAAIRPEVSLILIWDHIEQWSWGWQYSSNVTLLFWVPHHALAGWIGTATLVHTILAPPQKTHSLFLWSTTALWSPFVMIGLAPLLLVELATADGPLPKRLVRYVSLPTLCGLIMVAVIGLFYSAKLYPISPVLVGDMPHGFFLSFAPDGQAKVIGCALMLVFCVLEFGVYGLLIWPDNTTAAFGKTSTLRCPPEAPPEPAEGRSRGAYSKRAVFERTSSFDGLRTTLSRALLLTALGCLVLFPLYRYGASNDFVMRSSIPALYVLAVFLGRALSGRSLSRCRRVVLMTLLLLGSATPLIELRRHVEGIQAAGRLVQIPSVDQVDGVGDWGLATERDATILVQYVGSAQAPFFELLAAR
jgi:hypothetical protein